MDQSASDRREERSALIAGLCRLHHLGTGAGLLEAAQNRSGHGNSRASLRLDNGVSHPAPELAAAVERGPRSRAFAARHALLPNEWNFHRNQLVSVYLGGQYRPHHRNQPRLFHDPLVNVLFGAIFLRERLTRWQFVSVLLATVGVLNLTFGYGRFPWIALSLCFSFGLYGLLRKKSGTRAIPGLFFETIALAPIAAAYLLILHRKGVLAFGSQNLSLSFLLLISGVVTGLPLVWFGHAARHLRLTTVGFLQYLAPTCTFFLGVFLYHETFTRAHLITFTMIWIALAIFTIEAIWRWRSIPAAVDTAGENPSRVGAF